MIRAQAVRTGDLRHRVDIISDATTRSASGGKKEWTATTTVASGISACVRARTGTEQFGNPDVTVPRAQYSVWIRRRTDVTAKMRVKWDSRYFDIHHVPVTDKSVPLLELGCEEVA